MHLYEEYDPELSCKLFVNGDDISQQDLHALLIECLGDQVKSAELNSIDGLLFAIDVKRNEGFDSIRCKEADGFLFFRYYLDVDAVHGQQPAAHIALVSRILEYLWGLGYGAVAACDFEDELLHRGRLQSRQIDNGAHLENCSFERADEGAFHCAVAQRLVERQRSLGELPAGQAHLAGAVLARPLLGGGNQLPPQAAPSDGRGDDQALEVAVRVLDGRWMGYVSSQVDLGQTKEPPSFLGDEERRLRVVEDAEQRLTRRRVVVGSGDAQPVRHAADVELMELVKERERLIEISLSCLANLHNGPGGHDVLPSPIHERHLQRSDVPG